MMKKGCIVLTVFLASVLACGTAFAGGWGPYFQWSHEQPKAGFPSFFEDELIDLMEAAGASAAQIAAARSAIDAGDFDLSINHLQFGVLYDSAPSRDKLFNYRMSLGFDIATKVSADVEDIPATFFGVPVLPSFDIDESSKYGFGWRNTFGFGIIRTELLKWWVGPALNMNFDFWDENGVKAGILSIGGGAETGVNIHLGSSISLCVGGGILWNAFGYAVGFEELGSFVWGNGPFYFIQTAVLFHTGQDKTAWQ